jgi:hypothetical protein
MAAEAVAWQRVHDGIRKYTILPTHPESVTSALVYKTAAYVAVPAGLVNMFPSYIRKDYPKMFTLRAEEIAFQDDPKHRQMAGALLAEIGPILIGLNPAFSQVTEAAVLFPVHNLLYERSQAQLEHLHQEYEQLQQEHKMMEAQGGKGEENDLQQEYEPQREEETEAPIMEVNVDPELVVPSMDENDWKVMMLEQDVQEAGTPPGDISKRTGCTMQFWFDDDAVISV